MDPSAFKTHSKALDFWQRGFLHTRDVRENTGRVMVNSWTNFTRVWGEAGRGGPSGEWRAEGPLPLQAPPCETWGQLSSLRKCTLFSEAALCLQQGLQSYSMIQNRNSLVPFILSLRVMAFNSWALPYLNTALTVSTLYLPSELTPNLSWTTWVKNRSRDPG
jgi:hypothetical protein